MKLKIEKLYRYDRIDEHLSVAIPVKKGRLFNTDSLMLFDGGERLKIQPKITATYEDGSIRFIFLRFVATLPGRKSKEFDFYLDEKDYEAERGTKPVGSYVNQNAIKTTKTDTGFLVENGVMNFELKNYASSIFDSIKCKNISLKGEDITGPILTDGLGQRYEVKTGEWKIKEEGPLCTIFNIEGTNEYGTDGCEEGVRVGFEMSVTVWLDKEYTEITYRIINTTYDDLKINSLDFYIKPGEGALKLVRSGEGAASADSTGCGDMDVDIKDAAGPVYHTIGINDLALIEEKAPVQDIRTIAGFSNYRTDFLIGRNGTPVWQIVDASRILSVGNEHFEEVFYGTLFADRTDANGGICITPYKAQQNFPKSVGADAAAVYLRLVPEGDDEVVMASGTSREQRFLLHFHSADTSIIDIDDRSLIYQMKDNPVVAPKVFKESGAMEDIFADKDVDEFEIYLASAADSHSRSYGMMNFGDTIDWHYTEQGRGKGQPVWINNEYDYPHAAFLMYMRSGVRRFLDYGITHALHWMDVDICHFSKDKDRIGGMIEHTHGHVRDGVQVPSHEWCEGLLDYYHFTGDERGLEAAIGVGNNVLKVLEDPHYQKVGGANARETGWALRLFTALYKETHDEKWLSKCKWILNHFKVWYDELGTFEATYTDNTLVRTGFMTAVAAGSLMRYYRVFPSEELKELIMAAVDDIYDNCRLENGLFYYKELPSLRRNGGNPLLLEAMAIGYEFTGDEKYLKAGYKTFMRIISNAASNFSANKKHIGDAIVTGKGATKNFAQSFYPVTVFFSALVKAGMI